MAAEKARTNSQQVANYWYIQDNAWRSPESSHSPSSSSKLSLSEGSDHHVRGFVPDDQKYSNTEPRSEIRWWLNLEPTVSHLEDNKSEGLNVLGAEFGDHGAASLHKNVTNTGERQADVEGDIHNYRKSNDGYLVDSPQKAFANFMKFEEVNEMEELKVVSEDDLCRATTNEMSEYRYVDDNWKDLDPSKFLVLEKSEKLCSDLESHWIEVEKNEPWWRTADKDDLTSLVSSKKLEQFENCDLPQPRSKKWSGPSECAQCFDQATVASLHKKVGKETDVDEQTSEMPNSVSMFETQRIQDAVQFFPISSDRLISCRSDGLTNEETEAEALQSLDSDLTKAQLLEALCHSQTRAREAEKAAQQAYDEKEHIVKHFFRQASHLFAYKQWLKMLQIETLCLQLKNNDDEDLHHKDNNDDSISPHFPGLSEVSNLGRKVGKRRRKAAKRVVITNYKLIRSLASFALGLSLAGAGMLLGWTLGRFFPAM